MTLCHIGLTFLGQHGTLLLLTTMIFQALKVLRTAEYAPFVVFIAAPTMATFTEVI